MTVLASPLQSRSLDSTNFMTKSNMQACSVDFFVGANYSGNISRGCNAACDAYSKDNLNLPCTMCICSFAHLLSTASCTVLRNNWLNHPSILVCQHEVMHVAELIINIVCGSFTVADCSHSYACLPTQLALT